MIVFRLSKEKYKYDLSGVGAERAGGRWNSVGKPLLYTAANRALCTAEIAVHIPLGIVPTDYWLTSIEVPEGASIFECEKNTLPKDWSTFPHPPSTKKVGDAFLDRNEHLVLKVPSAVVQGEFNFLINPAHKDFGQVRILQSEPFRFDRRLFER